MLVDIHGKIFDVFKKSKIMDDSIDDASENSSSLNKAILLRLNTLKEQAEDAGSVEDLQTIISESIASVSDAMENFAKKQEALKLKNKNEIRSLSGELREAQSQIKKVQTKLESAEEDGLVDELSKLGNRKGYSREIEKSHNLWAAQRQNLSVIVLDIDKFKNINDTYGHAIGDQVIKKLGTIIKENTRSTDFSARYGGEEFVIICNNTCAENAAKLAEKIRRAIASRCFKMRDSEDRLKVTSSFGVAEFTPQRRDVVAVFKAADKALYKAKESGRNAVVLVKNNKLIKVNSKQNKKENS